MDYPLISIVVPVFNCANYLRRCVDSILSQTYSNLQIIIIDDGSMDESWNICKELKEKNDTMIEIHHQNNQGQAAARNRGVQFAKGDYIAFVDADDWIEKSMYEVLFANLRKEKAQISCCGIEKNRENMLCELYNPVINDYYVLSPSECIRKLLDNSIITSSPCDKLFSIDIVKNNPMIEGMVFEDYEVMPRWLHAAERVVYCGTPLYHYCYNTESTIQNVTLKRLDEIQASKIRTNFIIENYPELCEYALIKYIETNINVLGYTCNCDDPTSIRVRIKKEFLKSIKRINKHGLSYSYKARLALLVLGLPLFDFVQKLYRKIRRK